MTDPILSVEQLSKTYARSRAEDVVALDGITFSVQAGEVVGLLGPNGAGKTTTIKCVATLIRPSSGTIRVHGIDAVRHPRAAAARVAAVLEGNRNIYWRLSVVENLSFFAAVHGVSPKRAAADIEQLIELLDLGHKRDTPARMLSKGMQQKLALACALIKRARLVILDEPTLGLDVEASIELRSHLKALAREQGRTILFSSHDMAVVQDVCPRVIIIGRGRIITDESVEALLQLFRARAYRLTVTGDVTDPQRVSLSDALPAITFGHASGAVIEAEVLDPNGLYDLMDALRAEQLLIESIERQDPNLEQVFLKLVNGSA